MELLQEQSPLVPCCEAEREGLSSLGGYFKREHQKKGCHGLSPVGDVEPNCSLLSPI